VREVKRVPDPQPTFRRIAVLGLGALGGSLACLARARGLAEEVVGSDRDRLAAETARQLGLIDRVVDDAARAVMGAERVILAVPRDEIFKLMEAIGPDVKPGAVLTCTAGTTERLRVGLVRRVRSAENLVPAFPLVFARRPGPASSSAELVRARRVLVSTGAGPAVGEAIRFWADLGLRPTDLPPDRFEAAVAGHDDFPRLVAVAAARVARRGSWPPGRSALAAWMESVGDDFLPGRPQQLYATQLCALLSELIEELRGELRSLGGQPDECQPPGPEPRGPGP
jgi:cyclohexadieny/prephenate dehydrogenase